MRTGAGCIGRAEGFLRVHLSKSRADGAGQGAPGTRDWDREGWQSLKFETFTFHWNEGSAGMVVWVRGEHSISRF